MTALEILNLLIDWNAALAENARRDRFAKAKSNTEKLFHLGVLTTCDDEMERAYFWAHCEEQAKLAGVSTPAMRDALEYCRAAEAVVDELLRTYGNGETDAEQTARIQKAAAGGAPRFADGKKTPCKHNGTKRERGLMRLDRREDIEAGKMRFLCCRCGGEVVVDERPSDISEAAVEAGRLAAILVREDEPE